MNVELTHRGVRIVIGPDHAGERMWRAFLEGNIVFTGAVERVGWEDTLKRAIIEAQAAIDDWLATDEAGPA